MAYAGTIVGCTPDSQIKQILKLQKIALRIIGKVEFNGHTAPICKRHKIMYVRDILDLQAASQAWKFFNNKLPLSIASFFEKRNERMKLLNGTKFRNKRLQNISPIGYVIMFWGVCCDRILSLIILLVGGKSCFHFGRKSRVYSDTFFVN